MYKKKSGEFSKILVKFLAIENLKKTRGFSAFIFLKYSFLAITYSQRKKRLLCSTLLA